MPGEDEDWQSERLVNDPRSAASILNNRLDLPAEKADIYTPEQWQPLEWVKVDGEPVVWESLPDL